MFMWKKIAGLCLGALACASAVLPGAQGGDTASGTKFVAQVDVSRLGDYAIYVLDTEAPYEADWAESTASVGPYTTGVYLLEYHLSTGELIQLRADIQIDNVSHVMYHDGNPVATLADLFALRDAPRDDEPGKVKGATTHPTTTQISGADVTDKPDWETDEGWPILIDKETRPAPTEQEMQQFLQDAGLADKVQQTAPASTDYDCHGYMFTNGEAWINDGEVRYVLRDNGYQEVDAGKAKVGDVVVYRDANGQITHTGVVTKVDENGNVVEVESKWGSLPRFKHKPQDVPQKGLHPYGTPKTYHSDRMGANKLRETPKPRKPTSQPAPKNPQTAPHPEPAFPPP